MRTWTQNEHAADEIRGVPVNRDRRSLALKYQMQLCYLSASTREQGRFDVLSEACRQGVASIIGDQCSME